MTNPNTTESQCTRRSTCDCTGCADFKTIVENNQKWCKDVKDKDPKFFDKIANGQSPKFLWVGCADSRVVANQLMGLMPGDVFVHRNVGNVAMHTDLNCMSAIEYAVTALKVKHIILCGHYGCGAVKAALKLPQKTPGLVNHWISDIRQCRNDNATELTALDDDSSFPRLCELNVVRQTFHVCTSPVVQDAWSKGQELYVHGVIYGVGSGLLKRLVGPISSPTINCAHEEEPLMPGLRGVGVKVSLDPNEDPINRLVLKYQAIAALTFALGWPYTPRCSLMPKGWNPNHVPDSIDGLERKRKGGKGEEIPSGPEFPDPVLEKQLAVSMARHMAFEGKGGDAH